jgi:hypothetical protein
MAFRPAATVSARTRATLPQAAVQWVAVTGANRPARARGILRVARRRRMAFRPVATVSARTRATLPQAAVQ